METRMRRLTRTGAAATVAIAVVLALLVSPAAFAEDKACEKYHQHMEKYHKHLREAQEEARDGDWEEYHEEMAKARSDWAKAQVYKHLCTAPGGCSYSPKTCHTDHRVITTLTCRPQSGHSRDSRSSHGSGCSCGRSSRDRGHGVRPRSRHDGPHGRDLTRGILLRYSNGHFEIVCGTPRHGRRK